MAKTAKKKECPGTQLSPDSIQLEDRRWICHFDDKILAKITYWELIHEPSADGDIPLQGLDPASARFLRLTKENYLQVQEEKYKELILIWFAVSCTLTSCA